MVRAGGGGGGGVGRRRGIKHEREQYLSELQLKLVKKCFSYSTLFMVLDRQFATIFSYF